MTYVRDHEAVKATLVKINNSVITKTGCRIIFPERYEKKGLVSISESIYIYGMYALILPDNKYSVCNINAQMHVMPDRIEKVKFPDGVYYQLGFDPNSVVIVNTKLVRNEALIYNVFDETIVKGKIPWYFDYLDLGKIFDTSNKHAGSNVNKNLAVIELLASILARDPKDHNTFFRLIANNADIKPDFISLNNVYYATAGTLNKIAGAYLNKGIVGALVQPSNEVSKIERILRT